MNWSRVAGSRIAIAISGLLMLLAGLFLILPLRTTEPGGPHRPVAEPVTKVDPKLRAKIESWIQANGLNRFGDAPGTAYSGGTPLFDERTGKTRDRFEYILEKHPELRQEK